MITASLLLSACGRGERPPALAPSFSVNAHYTAGDFSYTCLIERTDNTLRVTVTSTAAEGLRLTCDGSAVTFEKGEMNTVVPVDKTELTNPAVLLYDVFSDIFGAAPPMPVRQGELFYYNGSCALGDYSLSVNDSGAFHTLSLQQMGISVIFD